MQANDVARAVSQHRLAVGAGLLVVVLALCEWLEWPFLRAPLQRLLADRLERPVVIGEAFGLRVFGPLRLRTDRLVIASRADGPALENAAGEARDLFAGQDVALSLPFGSVWRLVTGSAAPLHINSLDVGAFEAALRRDADGRANWHFGPPTRDRASAPLPQFARLTVRNGRVALDDAVLQLTLDAQARTLEGTAVTPGTANGKGASASVDAAAGGGTGAGAAAAAAPPTGLVVTAQGRYRGESLKAELRASGLLALATSRPDTPAVPMRADIQIADTRLHLDGKGRDLLHLHAFNGSYALEGRSLAAVGDTLQVTLPTTAAFSTQGHLAKEGVQWNVIVDEFTVGSSHLNGRFHYDPTPATPLLTGELAGPQLDLRDLIPAFGGAPEPRPRPRDRLLPAREFDIPSLARMNARIAVRLESFTLGTVFLEPMQPLRARIVLQDRVLTVDRLQARAARGEVLGSVSLDARVPLPRWTTDLSWSGIDLERFIKARDPYAARVRSATAGKKSRDKAAASASAGAAPGYISGTLGGHARLQGRGRSTAAMLASLDGNSQWWLRQASISRLLLEAVGLDIAQSLGLLISGDERLPVRCGVASLTATDGILRPQVAVIETDLTTTNVTGAISLADERLALRFTAHPRNVSPVTLRSPVHVEGSFAAPEVRLEPESIGPRVAAAAALAAVTPLAGLLALIDLGDSEKAVCQQALARIGAPAAGASSGEGKARRPKPTVPGGSASP